VEQVLGDYMDYLPLSIRQIFYILIGRGEMEKTESEYARLIYNLGRARRARLIDFDDIRDDGIVVAQGECYDGIEDFHSETARRAQNYRRNRQAGQPQFIELWTEAAGTIPQLRRIASEYSIPVFSCGGSNSIPAVRLVVDRACTRNVPTVILHCGDFDFAGESIYKAFSEDVSAFMDDDRVLRTQRVEFVRVALTEEQIDEYSLETIFDSKRKRETCQLEALAPNVLAEEITAWIEGAYLNLKRYAAVVADEQGERAELLGLPSGEAS
jgi:hypothetical protein